MLMSTNKNATLRYLIMDNQFCSEAWSSIGDIVSVCERSLSEDYGYLEIVSPESVREKKKRRIDNLRLQLHMFPTFIDVPAAVRSH